MPSWGWRAGRIHFSNGTHYSVNADGGVTWSEAVPGSGQPDGATGLFEFQLPDAQGRKRKSIPCAQSRSHSRSSRRAEAGHNMDIPMGWKEVFGTRMPCLGTQIVSQERCRCSSIRLSSQIVRLNRERNEITGKKRRRAMSTRLPMNRRDFLRLSTASAAGLVAAALCTARRRARRCAGDGHGPDEVEVSFSIDVVGRRFTTRRRPGSRRGPKEPMSR